jgi:hypothetical protein
MVAVLIGVASLALSVTDVRRASKIGRVQGRLSLWGPPISGSVEL